MRRTGFAILTAVLFMVAIAGCRNQEPVSGQPGDETSKPLPAQRIVSLAPNITEILFAIGAQDQIVGVTTFCDYPPEAAQYPKIGSFLRPSLELIIEARPDLILASGFETHPLLAKFEELDLPLVNLTPMTPEAIMAAIIEIGRLTGREDQAKRVTDSITERLARIRDQVARVPEQDRPRIFIEIGFPPLFSAGPDTFVSRLIEEAGGINVLRGVTTVDWPQISSETVFAMDPDFIVLGYMVNNASINLSQRTGWDQIDAVTNGRIIADVDPNLYLRQGPRFIDGIEIIHGKLDRFYEEP